MTPKQDLGQRIVAASTWTRDCFETIEQQPQAFLVKTVTMARSRPAALEPDDIKPAANLPEPLI